MAITNITNEDLDLLNESIERVPFYCSYPEEFNIIPATIYFNTKQKKIIKQPKVDWIKYQIEKYPREKLNGKKPLCIVCGKISNNLLVIDFDKNKSSKLTNNQIYENIIQKHPLLEKSGYVVKTMNGGFHFYFFFFWNLLMYIKNLMNKKLI